MREEARAPAPRPKLHGVTSWRNCERAKYDPYRGRRRRSSSIEQAENYVDQIPTYSSHIFGTHRTLFSYPVTRGPREGTVYCQQYYCTSSYVY